ncbi:hypothetical protein [Mycobacterium palustre]|uniref:Uncharacterized protein n=1 Tax=Mycobacterium palustre TaxID=153971 RepID=A0A1X1ZQ98_9MYCO|nr:hypothetical protein [Mycobacterium palustre]MCV7101911.1 hypothetical protein [Mycobacterium palustre]ORW25569.1 hypothetical protein AWC19_06710 [Mycobacterium palustre]
MSVQDDKEAGRDREQRARDDDEDRGKDHDDDRPLTEKPEPDEEDKKQAAEMMTAYEDRPTLVLPGSGGMVSGTAVNDWLDDEGNPRHEVLDAGPEDKGGTAQAEGDDGKDEQAKKEQIEQDKALNEELKKASAAENKGEND